MLMASLSIGCAWITYSAASFPAIVATTFPTDVGACFIAFVSISFPPTSFIASATPPPIISWLSSGVYDGVNMLLCHASCRNCEFDAIYAYEPLIVFHDILFLKDLLKILL